MSFLLYVMKITTRYLFFVILVILPLPVFSKPQEAKVNKKKIEHQRAKQYKEAQKQFNLAIKRHYQNQSKATKARMKQSKKEASKLTPIGL